MLKFAIGAVLGLLLGLLVAQRETLKSLPTAIRRFVSKALLPVLLVAGFGLALGVTVALVRHYDAHEEFWALVIAGGFLLGVTLLLYSTGETQYTARSTITIGKTKTIKKGDEIIAADLEKIPDDDLASVETTYKAKSDFTIPGTEKSYAQGQELKPDEYKTVPQDHRDKFEEVHVANERVTWQGAAGTQSADAGETLAAEAYGKLSDAEKKKVRTAYRAKSEFKYDTSQRPIKAGDLLSPDDYALYESVRANSTTVKRATRDITIPEQDGKIIKSGERIVRDDYAHLPPQTRTGSVTSQHGLYFRSLVVGVDGRWSTSKLQAILWTYAVLFGLVSLFVYAVLFDKVLHLDPDDLSKAFHFGDMELQEQYLLLLGGPFAAAVIAKASTASKVADGVLAKSTDTGSGNVNGLREVISNDAGRTDLIDFQYFFFNIVALLVFAVTFLRNPDQGFPVLPWFLVGLTSTSALAYTTKKTLEQSQPQITSLLPRRVRPGKELMIKGRYLITPPALKPDVTVGDHSIDPSDVVIKPEEARADVQSLAVTIPPDTKAGNDQSLIVVPQGTSLPVETTIDIAAPAINSVQPSSLALLPGEEIRIYGNDFGPKPERDDAVTLGPLKLVVRSWDETQITAQLPEKIGAALSGEAILRIVDAQGRPAETRVTVLTPETSVDDVIPSTIRVTEPTELTVVGKGFGDDAGQVSVGDVQLEDVVWDKNVIRGVFKPTNAERYKDLKTLNVLVLPTNGLPGVKTVQVSQG